MCVCVWVSARGNNSLHSRLFTVDGNWSEWSVWEECSRSCGQGNRTRVRTCTDPPAQHGGRPCEGKAVDVAVCSVRPCPGKGEESIFSKTQLMLWVCYPPFTRLTVWFYWFSGW